MTHTTHATPSRMIILCRHETEHVPVLYDARIHGTTVRTYPDRASCQAACDRLNPRQGDQEDPMITIRQLNQQLRDRYEGARHIRHYQGARHDETHLTTDRMPNTDRPGRIGVGYSDALRTQTH